MSAEDSISRRGIVAGRSKVKYKEGVNVPRGREGKIFEVLFPLSTKGKLTLMRADSEFPLRQRFSFKDWHTHFDIVE